MSSRPAILALLITLLLAVGAYFVLRPEPAKTNPFGAFKVGDRPMAVDTTGVTAITIENPPAAAQVLEKAADGRWSWRESAKATRRFALDETRTRAFFRMFAEAQSIADVPEDTHLPPQPLPVVLTLRSPAGDTVIRLSPRALGGQVLAEIVDHGGKPRPAVLKDDVLTVLTSPGPSAWRDPRPLAADPALASRITFTDATGTSGFGLVRRDGQWSLAAPAPAGIPADFTAVAAVIKTIDSLTITRFFDGDTQPTTAAAGLDTPSGVLTLEFDDRTIDPATQQPTVKTRTARLVLGQPADAKGVTLYASADGGATIVGVDALPLSKLTTPAHTLAMRTATRTPAADVGAVEIASGTRTVRLTRDSVSGRWTETLDATAPVTQDPAKAAESETILTLFTKTVADSVSFNPPAGAGISKRATVALLTPSGQPLDRFDILYGTTGGGLTIATMGPTTSPVYRSFGKPPDAFIRWLAVLQR